mmetsp:Transcript_44350/g.139938  ORF Transcript_44350/g.139938 Transcript_44350/m.139938 type:complete len:256 (-) Transcript_44350:674-1441(-)
MGVDKIPLLEKHNDGDSSLDAIDICIPTAYEPATTQVARNTPLESERLSMPQPSAPEYNPSPREDTTSKSILCANCKTPLATNHKFCPECGTPTHSGGPSNTPGANLAEFSQSGTFPVKLPAGVRFGQTLRVQVPAGYRGSGEIVYFAVPAEASPGQIVQVPLPATNVGSTEYFQARIPQSCHPGQVMQVRVPEGYRNAGELVRFTIPAGTGPNQVIKVPLPSNVSQAVGGKFKVCLPLNCSPGQVSLFSSNPIG